MLLIKHSKVRFNRSLLHWDGGPGVKSSKCPRNPSVRKRRLNGAFSRNNRIKRDGHVKEPYEMSMALGARP